MVDVRSRACAVFTLKAMKSSQPFDLSVQTGFFPLRVSVLTRFHA
jgi:hypothetical protein